MLTFAKKYGRNDFSQFGEDGIIEEILHRIKIEKPACAEFGAHNGVFCSNTFRLIKSGKAAKSIMIEMSHGLYKQCRENMSGYNVDVLNCAVIPENINILVGPYKPDLLSIDTDGPCYSLWKAYTGMPAIVVIEINSSYDTTAEGPISDKENGTAYKPMVELGISKGYFLVTHTGNLTFVDNQYRDLFPEIIGDGLENAAEYFDTSWIKK